MSRRTASPRTTDPGKGPGLRRSTPFQRSAGAGRSYSCRGSTGGPVRVGRAYAGTEERPTVLKAEAKWKAVIVGAPDHGISNGDDCAWFVVEGFEVLGARSTGVKLNGDHNAVRDCWVHNNGHMGISAHGKKGTVIEGNLVEFNGQHVQLHHGLYVSGEGITIRRNVVRHNAAYGLHLYSRIADSRVEQNVVAGHARKAGILVACPEGGGRNVVVHNTLADNQGGIEVWRGDGETVANNIVLVRDGAPLVLTNGSRNVRQEGNFTSGDPKFVDPAHGVYWLKAASPAIGSGAAGFAPRLDFWGRAVPKDRPADAGAFVYEPNLRAPWAPSRWPYAFGWTPGDERGGPPDFWAAPDGAK